MSRGKPLLIGKTIILTGMLLSGCAGNTDERPAESRQGSGGATAITDGAAAAEAQPIARGISIGSENAPVVVHEFADFQCPACAQFAEFATPGIKERYVNAGIVRYVHYDFPLTSIHPNAFLAAVAARCADEQGGFWRYHDELYALQASWNRAEDAAPHFIDFAEDVGLERAAFAECLSEERFADEVTRNARLGEALGVRGTPSIFINGRQVQLSTLEDLDRLILSAAGIADSKP